MAAGAARIKLHFEGTLGQQLAELSIQKCWYAVLCPQTVTAVAGVAVDRRSSARSPLLCRYQLPAASNRGSKLQTVTDLVNQVSKLLGTHHLCNTIAKLTAQPVAARLTCSSFAA